MKKSNIKLIALITIVLLAVSLEANAQLGPIDFDNDTGIDEAVPINGLIYLAMAIGGYLGFKNLKGKN